MSEHKCKMECISNEPICKSRHGDFFTCTRNKGHDGEHVACNILGHDICSWPQEPKADTDLRKEVDAQMTPKDVHNIKLPSPEISSEKVGAQNTSKSFISYFCQWNWKRRLRKALFNRTGFIANQAWQDRMFEEHYGVRNPIQALHKEFEYEQAR